jgi:hypothetical protein
MLDLIGPTHDVAVQPMRRAMACERLSIHAKVYTVLA